MTNRNINSSRRGTALMVSLIAVLVVSAFATSIMVVGTGEQQERRASVASARALYVAEAGMSQAIVRVEAGTLTDIGAVDAQVAFSGGNYWVDVTDNGDQTFTVTSFGTVGNAVRATEATLVQQGQGVYTSALFAGNLSGDMTYDMKFGGSGTQADVVNGNIYSGGNVPITGTATINGSIKAAGAIAGSTGGTSGSSLPVPNLTAMDYEHDHDYDVKSMFATATYVTNSALGGKAYQMPESSPAHIFRKNPNDRTANTSTTSKDDYFLEDPYESVNTSSTVAPGSGTHITLSGQDGNPGVDGSDKVYFIDGNLWIHNNKLFSFTMYNSGSTTIRATFVVKGNIYFSDNVMYQGTREDGIAFIAMKDSTVTDSGNIYFGDPSFGTLERMDSFMYAENNFCDNNLSATGSARVTVNGNMTAGNQVKINRDYGAQHSKLTVNFDDRLVSGTVTLPGLPSQSGAAATWLVRGWHEVAIEP